ncbi:protein FAM124A [Osmerus mordax]|uniref:protein FAM124A n=1 Tax=Osmerus mordax TaxID=8014 RepID=UPI0035103D32
MSLSSEMEKISTEDDCVDSGAETGGSDYSPMSSASSDFSMGELQDPFLVSVHLISDPGQGKTLQRAADGVLSWLHPQLQLFRVSERTSRQARRPSAAKRQSSQCPPPPSLSSNHGPPQCQPALAVILFLQESDGGEEQIAALHRALQRPPWRFHHTERVSGGRHVLPLAPGSQDFFTLAPGTPLWAVRQVHYGKEIVRFTVYCCYDSFPDQVRLYRLLLRRRLAQRKDDFCFLVVYSNPDTEIQLSFKRLPRGQSPVATESSVMEVRVRDVGALVPLLPHPCSPISEARWQTEDYDGNKILLQVQGARSKRWNTDGQGGHLVDDSSPTPSPPPSELVAAPPQSNLLGRAPVSTRTRRYHRQSQIRTQNHEPRLRACQASQTSLPLAWEEGEAGDDWAPQRHPEAWRTQWTSHRASSLFSLPTTPGHARSTCSSPGAPPSPPALRHTLPHSRSASLVPPFRLNVDALIGAEETDVDTGMTVETGSIVDLSVVSAYNKPRLSRTPRPVSAPPEDVGPVPPGRVVTKAATLGRPPIPTRSSSLSSKSMPATLQRSRPQSTCLPMNGHLTWSDNSLSQLDSTKTSNGEVTQKSEGQSEEDDQEFYI